MALEVEGIGIGQEENILSGVHIEPCSDVIAQIIRIEYPGLDLHDIYRRVDPGPIAGITITGCWIAKQCIPGGSEVISLEMEIVIIVVVIPVQTVYLSIRPKEVGIVNPVVVVPVKVLVQLRFPENPVAVIPVAELDRLPAGGSYVDAGFETINRRILSLEPDHPVCYVWKVCI